MPGNHVLLETIELTQNASSVLFDNIPQTGYTDLKIIVSARSTRAGAQEDGLGVRLNSSTTGYTYKILGSSGGSTFQLNTAYEQTWVCNIPAVNTTANIFSATEVYITNYTDSTPKTYSTDSGAEHNGATGYLSIGQMTQSTAAPVTSLTLLAQNGNLLAGSTFSLYAIAAKNTTPAIAPKATGGNIVANDGTYWYHAFLSSGTFTPQTTLTCDYLVVGGGGSASRYGGGGAGGYRTASESLTVSNYAVIIGAGGATTYANVQGNNGTSSTFSSITSAGGGGGGSLAATGTGLAGASGGGGGSDGTYAGGAGNTPSTSPAQGFAGGSGTAAHPYYVGGGGGGATTVGGNGSGFTGGNGGTGSNAHSTWASATGTGVSGYYAGGGGGVGYNYPGTGVGGAAGAGGGGAGRSIGDGSQTPVPGTVNTGGGGGGGWNSSGLGSNAGGSGIVIIRYAMV